MNNIESNIRVLERRAEHLSTRLARTPKELAYDQAERHALLWAARQLRQIHTANND